MAPSVDALLARRHALRAEDIAASVIYPRGGSRAANFDDCASSC